MKKYVDPKIILLLFCYYVYNKAYGIYPIFKLYLIKD